MENLSFKKKFFIIILAIIIACVVSVVAIKVNKDGNVVDTNDLQTKNQDLDIQDNATIDEFCHYEATAEELAAEVSPASQEGTNYQPTMVQYTKGMSSVNILLNFITYNGDAGKKFGDSQISGTVSDFANNLNRYYSVASNGIMNISVDYIKGVAPNSYSSYLNRSSADYSTESNIFASSVAANTRYLQFTTYNIRINIFAGDCGSWNTFLWPHAYGGSALILLTQNKINCGTTCHELGHVFGAPDLYAYTGDQTFACGNWDLMGSSNYESINANTRKSMGWIEESSYDDNITTKMETIKSGSQTAFTVNIYPAYTSDQSKTIAYKFGEYYEDGHKEFFVVEYRIKNYLGFFDPSMRSDKAVVIYRVNETVRGNSNANKSDGKAEIVYMGNQGNSVSSSNYLSSVALGSGATYGSTSNSSKTKLCYCGGSGSSNTFTGKNSNIVLKVNSISSDKASVTITYPSEQRKTTKVSINFTYQDVAAYTGFLSYCTETQYTYKNADGQTVTQTFTCGIISSSQVITFEALYNTEITLKIVCENDSVIDMYNINGQTTQCNPVKNKLNITFNPNYAYTSNQCNIVIHILI